MTDVIDLTARQHRGAGSLALQVNAQRESWAEKIMTLTNPAHADSEWLHDYRRKNLHNIMRGVNKIQAAESMGIMMPFGMLYLKVIEQGFDEAKNEFFPTGNVRDYGLVSCRVVTNNGVAFLVDALQNIVEAEVMRYHGFGTTNTAENVADTALAAECSTVLNPDSTRGQGTLAEGATGNIYRTVGTVTFDGSATIVEHGLLSQQAVGGGVLFDRSVFAGIGVVTTNALQATYDLTFTAGS